MLASVSHIGHRSTRTTPRQFNRVDCLSSLFVQCKKGWPTASTVSCAIVSDKENGFSQQGARKSTTTQWSRVWYAGINQPLPGPVTERDLPGMISRVHVDCCQP